MKTIFFILKGTFLEKTLRNLKTKSIFKINNKRKFRLFSNNKILENWKNFFYLFGDLKIKIIQNLEIIKFEKKLNDLLR